MSLSILVLVLFTGLLVATCARWRRRPFGKSLVLALVVTIAVAFLVSALGLARGGLETILIGASAALAAVMLFVSRRDQPIRAPPGVIPAPVETPRPSHQPLILEPESDPIPPTRSLRMKADDES